MEQLRPTSADSIRYWGMLKDMNDDVKLELIALLSNSVVYKVPPVDDENWASRFSGAWKDSRSAEEIINDIRNNRTSNTREIDL